MRSVWSTQLAQSAQPAQLAQSAQPAQPAQSAQSAQGGGGGEQAWWWSGTECEEGIFWENEANFASGFADWYLERG